MVNKKKRNVAHLEAAMLICVQKIARYSHVIKIDQSLIRKARNQSTSFKLFVCWQWPTKKSETVFVREKSKWKLSRVESQMKRNLSECMSNQKVDIGDLESDWMTPGRIMRCQVSVYARPWPDACAQSYGRHDFCLTWIDHWSNLLLLDCFLPAFFQLNVDGRP